MMRQQTIDFPRGEQLSLLARVKIPVAPRAGISASSVKFVLRTIDDFARGGKCWASQETIAARTDLSVRTIKRAIHILHELSLVCIDRHHGADGKSRNHYTIVWSELAVLGQVPSTAAIVKTDDAAGGNGEPISDGPRGRTRHFAHGDQGDAHGDQGDAHGDQGDAHGDQGDAHVPHNRPRKRNGNGSEGEPASQMLFDDDARALGQHVVDSINRITPVCDSPDVRFVVKLAILVASRQVPQSAVWESIQGLKMRVPRPRKPLAYLHRSVDNALGGELNRLLSGVPESALPRAARRLEVVS